MSRITRKQFMDDPIISHKSNQIKAVLYSQSKQMYSKLPKNTPMSVIDWTNYCQKNNIIDDVSDDEYLFGRSFTQHEGPVYDGVFHFLRNLSLKSKAINHDRKWEIL